MKNLNETSEKVFLNGDAAKKFFKTICETDIWQRCYTKELSAVPVDNCPILMEEIMQRTNISSADVSTESMRECMESINLGLSVPFKNGMKTYPLGDTSLVSLVQRAGYQSSPVLTMLAEKASVGLMPPTQKSMVINTGLSCFKNKAIVLVRDEKIRAVLSGDESDYSVLRFDELDEALEDGLKNDYANVTFDTAFASHTLFGTGYTFHDADIEKQLAQIFHCKKIKICVRLVSSDVGMSGANIYPYVIGDGCYYMIGTPLSLTHKDRHTLGDFKNNVQKICSTFKMAADMFERLEKIRVRNMASMIRRIAKQVGLPKKLSCEAAEQVGGAYGSNAYATDVYWELYSILEKYEADSPTFSQGKRLSIEEGIARIFVGHIEEYDVPFQWE